MTIPKPWLGVMNQYLMLTFVQRLHAGCMDMKCISHSPVLYSPGQQGSLLLVGLLYDFLLLLELLNILKLHTMDRKPNELLVMGDWTIIYEWHSHIKNQKANHVDPQHSDWVPFVK